MKPRLYVRNLTTQVLSNFKVQYYFTIDTGKQPVLEDFYTPYSVPKLEQVQGTLYRVVYDFTGATLYPGQVLPDTSGDVVGLHYSDWSTWKRSDDWSYQGVTGTFAPNGRVVVIDSGGSIVAGELPPGVVPPNGLLTQSLQVRAPHDTDVRNFAILADGSLKMLDRVEIKGRAANMGASGTTLGVDISSGTFFSKSAITGGDRAQILGDIFKGGSINLPTSANVSGVIKAATFDPATSYTLTLSHGAISAPTVTALNGQVASPAPGRYNDLQVSAGGRVVLSSGAYYFNDVSKFVAGAVLTVNDAAGPVRVFVGKPFNFLGSVERPENDGPSNLLIGVLGTGSLQLSSQFAGTFWAPKATINVASSTLPLQGAVYGASVQVAAATDFDYQRPAALACLPKQVRVPVVGSCTGSALTIASHKGVTRALWEGVESLDTGKRASPVEKFTFQFSKAISIPQVAGTVSIVSTSCDLGTSDECGHEVALKFEYGSADKKTVIISNPDDAFHPGCEYELKIGRRPLNDNGECLSSEQSLAFRTLTTQDLGALEYETDSARRNGKTERLRALEMRSGVSWDAEELFQVRRQAFELREGMDEMKTVGTAHLYPTEKVQHYVQHYRGVPVLGHGYEVRQDLSTGRVNSLVGRTVSDLGLNPTPAISQSTARSSNLWRFPTGSTVAPGTLVVTGPSGATQASQFKLAWRLVGTTSRSFKTIFIDAMTGALIGSEPGQKNACRTAQSVDVSTLTRVGITAVNVPNLQAETYGSKEDMLVSSYTGSGGSVINPLERLATDDPDYPVAVRSMCDGEQYPKVIKHWGSSQFDTETTTMAQAQLGVDGVLSSFKGYRQRDGSPWIGWDGTGSQPIELRSMVVQNSDLAAQYIPGGVGSYILIDTAEYAGSAGLDGIGHEMGHLVLYQMQGIGTGWEYASIHEGFSSVVGAVAEYAERLPLVPEEAEFHLWCFGGDFTYNLPEHCVERFDDPRLTGAPKFYKGEHWLTEPPADQCVGCENDCPANDTACFERCALCDVHTNAGVLEHWFYLLAMGGEEDNYCGATVTALAPDLTTAVNMASNLLWETMLGFTAGGDYDALVEASISTVRRLYPDDEDKERSVIAAWQAVGLHDGHQEDQDVYPPRDAEDVNPWGFLVWDKTEPGTTLQIDSSATFNSKNGQPEIEVEVPSSQSTSDDRNYYQASLEPNTRYYWRFRSTDKDGEPWLDCQPTYWFTTGELPQVESVYPDGSSDLIPGSHSFNIRSVEGPSEYHVRVSSTNSGCDAPGDLLDQIYPTPPVPWDDPYVHALVHGFQPYEHYWINVLPLGPEPDQVPGRCYTVELPVGGMPQPGATSPDDGARFTYHPPRRWNEQDMGFTWRAQGDPGSFDLTFYERRQDGTCESDAVHTETVDAQDVCSGTFYMTCDLEDDLFPEPNPSGYCWEVTSISQNGDFRSDPSEMQTFGYFLTYVFADEPGVQAYYADSREDPGAILDPAGAFDEDDEVKFTWAPQEGIHLYGFRLARWPWPIEGQESSTLDPENCLLSSSCDTLPDGDYLAYEIVADTEITVPADKAGKGRYCWDVWAIVSDPDEPEVPHARQPGVYPYTNCYTTGPSKPTVEITQDTPGNGSSQPIVGEIKVDYIPDGQFDLLASHPDATDWDFDDCKPVDDAVRYLDYYDCRVEFRVDEPEEGEKYNFGMRVSNNPEFTEEPGAEEEFEVYVTQLDDPVDVGNCGELDEACCEGRICDCASGDCEADEVVCDDDDMCSECGGTGDYCCEGDNCRGDRICDDGVCLACGSANEPCCEDNECDSGSTCEDGTCESCGGAGEACCAGGECDSDGLTCDGSSCQYCGNPGEPCCDGFNCSGGAQCESGYCENVLQCNQQVFAGGNEGGSFEVELGATSGTFTFTVNTYTQPDSFNVYYEGSQFPNLFTGCWGTADLVPGCLLNGWCCDGAGLCWVDQYYSGSSSKMVVEVAPNCAGGVDTEWAFTLSCP